VVSILPITFGLLRYGLLLERGHGGAPEDVVLRDRPLLVAGLAWLVVFTAGTVLAGR
jgi:decaprenyl-phosphate phosphoribosyltransferase